MLSRLPCLAPLLLFSALQDDPWVVDEAHGPEVAFEREFSEGTWISVDVSPDGQTLVFDHLGHIYRMPIGGGRATPLATGRAWSMFPRFSPDGKLLAFTSDRGGSNDLWTLDLASGELVNRSKQKTPVFQGTWSRDGQGLYGTGLNMKVRFPVHRFDLRGGKQEIFPAGGRTPINHVQEHAASESLYYIHNDANLPTSGPRIKRLDTRSGEVEIYVDRPGGAAALRLSPDGKQLVYVHRNDKTTELVLHHMGTQEERVLARGLDRGRLDSSSFYGAYPNLAWAPDGSEVFFSMGGGIHAVRVADGSLREIPFRVSTKRQLAKTFRFRVEIPEGETHTRSHRWSLPTPHGILSETLGDLWLADGEARHNLTESAAHETNPIYDPEGDRIFMATWNDRELGAIQELRLPSRELRTLTTVASQYGSLALSQDGEHLAYLRGDVEIRKGKRLEDQRGYELVLLELASGEERLLTEVSWLGNRYAKRPPFVGFAPGGEELCFTEYDDGALVLKRIDLEGHGEQLLARFPNATRAVLSPTGDWVAFREYHRSFVAPFPFVGRTLRFSAADKLGSPTRVDAALDGDFTEWTRDGKALYWTRGAKHHTKSLAAVLAGEASVESHDLAVPFEVEDTGELLLLRNVRLITMNAEREVLEDQDVLIEGKRISRIGKDLRTPTGARVLDLEGTTLMPGMFDAHGHYGSPISALNVIEQRLYGLQANLAYGVTTMFDVYGTTQKDFWLSDMLRAGKIDGPRIHSVGDPVFVTKYRSKMHRPIESLADANEIARFNKDHGASALKDYSNHTRAARQQLAKACRDQGLNLVTESFANPQMNFTQLVDGFTGIEHTFGLSPLYEDVIELMLATETQMTPTLIVCYDGPSGEGWFYQRERLWEDQKLLHFFNKDELLRHRRPTHYFEDEFRHPSMARELSRIYRRGFALNMGAHGQKMGIGAHWEVEMFVHGGFTEHEALEIATIHGFRHHGLDHELGSIEAGKLADLVILDANPLEDITHTRSIRYVIKNGVLHLGADATREGEEFQPMYFSTNE